MLKKIRRATVKFMDDLIFSYTTKEAVLDGVLVKTDEKITADAGIKFPVYVTSAVWEKYIKVPEEMKSFQDVEGRLWDILIMFALKAKSCDGALLEFNFHCRIPNEKSWESNEKKSEISLQHREIRLKAVISAQDIDDPSPAIFIMKPWED